MGEAGRRQGTTLVALILVLALAAAVGAAGRVEAANAPALQFRSVKVIDPLGGNIEAFRLLVPRGWIWKGGVRWNLNYATLASVAMRVRNPRGLEAVESYPLIPLVWNTSTPLGPEGGNYLGSEVRRPLSPADFLQRLVIPTLRGGLRPSVVRVTPLPKVARALAAGPSDPTLTSEYGAARVRITYRENGRAIEEDFYVGLAYQRSSILPAATLWQPLFLYSFKAGQGQLDRASRIMQAIVASVRPSLRWYAGYKQVFKLWTDGQMASIRAAGALSRTISDANDSITASLRDSWRAQQDSYDRIYGQVSEQIRGVETYDNPFEGHPVQLPSDYGYAWVSASGEYSLSNDAGFNPNTGSTVNWRLLKPS